MDFLFLRIAPGEVPDPGTLTILLDRVRSGDGFDVVTDKVRAGMTTVLQGPMHAVNDSELTRGSAQVTESPPAGYTPDNALTAYDAESGDETDESAPAAFAESLPPGIAPPPGETAPRRRGRPPRKTADEIQGPAQAAAPVPAGLPPGIADIPPGVAQLAPPPALSAPLPDTAVPSGPALESSAGLTLADVRECIAQINTARPGKPFRHMSATAWSDGTPKGKWFTVESIPSSDYDRLIREMTA